MPFTITYFAGDREDEDVRADLVEEKGDWLVFTARRKGATAEVLRIRSSEVRRVERSD